MTAHLRILCFGDSLTEGYTLFGTRYSPYSEAMKRALDAGLSDNWVGNERKDPLAGDGERVRVEVLTDGLSGDLVCGGSFEGRMGRRCGCFCCLIKIMREEGDV